MSFLLIDNTEIDVMTDSAELEYEEIGDRERAFSGQLLENIMALKRKWTIDTPPLDDWNLTSLLSGELKYGVDHTIEGDMVDGEEIKVRIKITRIKPVVWGTDFKRQLTFDIMEV